MRIDKIEAIAISIPLKKNFGGATYDVKKRCTVITRIHAGELSIGGGGEFALGAFGVYLGRFERWNSWDVFTKPQLLAHDLLPHVAHPQDHPRALAVMVLFTAFLAMSYLVFYAFAQPEAAAMTEASRPGPPTLPVILSACPPAPRPAGRRTLRAPRIPRCTPA